MATRLQIEQILIGRQKAYMEAAGMNTTASGSNPDIHYPLAETLLEMGYTVPDLASVTAIDPDGVTAVELADRAELRLLKNILGNLALVDFSVGPRRESYSQLSAQVEAAIHRVSEDIGKKYGVDLGTLTAGVINLNFSQHGDR